MREEPPTIPQKTFSDLEWSAVIDGLAARCRTTAGEKHARHWGPCDSSAEAQQRAREISEARDLATAGEPIYVDVELDHQKTLQRLAKQGILEPEKLQAVCRTLEFGATLRNRLLSQGERYPLMARMAVKIRPLSDIYGPIKDSFEPTGELRDEASSELGGLRQKARALREEIVGRLKELMERPDMERLLQDKYYTLREQRYVLPVKVEMQHLLPGIVHARSQTEATVFMEPAQITELGNRLKMAFSDVEWEERRILMELSGLVREEIPAVKGNLSILARIDVLSAAARLAEDWHGSPVAVTPQSALSLREARHPLMVLAGDTVVENDFTLGKTGSLVITGPNAGGKTVALKTVGLVCLLAQSGLHPPCRAGSNMPFWRGIYTSIGDDQNISARLSTFTAHMSNLKRILDRAGPNDLVLLDEVAVGTEPTQGAALARAVLERLADCGAQVMVTTHYMALKAIAVEDNRFANAAMGFDSETMAPTYALEEGALGRSSAFSVARSLGLEEGLLARAEELLGGGGLRVDGLLAELEKQRRVLLENQQAVEAERAAAHREHEKAEKKRRTLAKELEALQKQTHDETVLELRSLRDELARMRKALRKGPKSVRRLEQGEAKATDAAKRLSALAPQEESPGGRPVRKGELREGDRVVVKKMGTLGKVISVDGRGGRATVQVGAVQMQTKVNELVFPPAGPRAPQTKAEKRKPEARRKPPVNVAPKHDAGAESEAGMDSAADAESVDPALFVRDPGATLDLRGMRVDEASEALDKFLDHMYGENRPAVLIIHGYGTGAVRKRVRQDLRRSPVVTRFRPGRRKEGGDGVTVAFFSE